MNPNNKGNSKGSSLTELQTLKLNKLKKDIESMDSTEITNALKDKSLPIYGSLQQKRERLK